MMAARCTKDEYLQKLRELNTLYRPTAVMIETVAAQEYLAQDGQRYMPVVICRVKALYR
jgi:hypothetical protein